MESKNESLGYKAFAVIFMAALIVGLATWSWWLPWLAELLGFIP